MEVGKMTIEPLSSAMTYTAQPAKPVAAPAAETMEGKPMEANVPMVDAQTIADRKSVV